MKRVALEKFQVSFVDVTVKISASTTDEGWKGDRTGPLALGLGVRSLCLASQMGKADPFKVPTATPEPALFAFNDILD